MGRTGVQELHGRQSWHRLLQRFKDLASAAAGSPIGLIRSLVTAQDQYERPRLGLAHALMQTAGAGSRSIIAGVSRRAGIAGRPGT
jgi:hypothetical protein